MRAIIDQCGIKVREVKKITSAKSLSESVGIIAIPELNQTEVEDFDLAYTSKRFGFLRLNGEDVAIFHKNIFDELSYTYYTDEAKRKVRSFILGVIDKRKVNDYNILRFDDELIRMLVDEAKFR